MDIALGPTRRINDEAVIRDAPASITVDVAIIGSGMGGGTLAYGLSSSGTSVLMVEQGDFLPREQANWDPGEVHARARYRNAPEWLDHQDKPFVPSNYHYVGGATKVYGATGMRLRESDFGVVEHPDGLSPAWPLSYDELEPHYAAAERMYWVHGRDGDDPTEPRRSGPYPYPPVEHETAMEGLASSLRSQGLHPFYLPEMLDLGPGGGCIRCSTCDGFPCMVDSKGDADVCAVRPALASGTVRLLPNGEVLRLETDSSGKRVVRAIVATPTGETVVHADRFVVAGGAINSAALLLRSASHRHEAGLANGSDQVGRNYMTHTLSYFVGIDPRRRNTSIFQKTLAINDWYEAGADHRYPLGNVQALGKLSGQIIKPARTWVPTGVLDRVTRHTIDLLAQTEDLPVATNRVSVTGQGQIKLQREATNVSSHRELIRRLRRHVRRAGYPIIVTEAMGNFGTAHQCGTVRMGDDPQTSVVDRFGRSHDVPNLWVCDASVFPSSAAVNPALTVAALALRLADSGQLTS